MRDSRSLNLITPRGTRAYRNDIINTTTFYGLNRGLTVSDGELNDMTNLTSDYYPQLASCLPKVDSGMRVEGTYHGSIKKGNDIYTAAGTYLTKNGTVVDGLTLTDSGNNNTARKLMVSMGAQIIIWPDKVYYNTVTGESGPLGNAWSGEDKTVTCSPCTLNGTVLDSTGVRYTISATEPTSKQNGDYWYDSANERLMIYNATGKAFEQVTSTFIRLGCEGIGDGFSVGDSVYLSSTDEEETYTFSAGTEEAKADMNKCIDRAFMVEAVEDDAITIVGLIQGTCSVSTMHVERRVPDFHYACEANNRIWGCQYGEEISLNGEFVNQLMACALGDPKNWETYEQVSTDSYAVSLGSDGPFTGAFGLNGVPYFFREGTMIRITGSIPEEFSTDIIDCRGVDAGDALSLRRIEQSLIYKSMQDVLLYNNGSFSNLGTKLGATAMAPDCIGSTVLGLKYYMAMTDGIYVYDYAKGIWHRQYVGDCKDVIATDEHVYFLVKDGAILKWLRQTTEAENDTGMVDWSATFGAYGYDDSLHKYLTRFDLRMQLQKGARVTVEIQYDHESKWYKVGTLEGRTVQSFLLPVVPRRCDHCQVRISGHGPMKLLGLARIYERGSDA